jgi:predicted Zn-dependent protease
MLDKSHSERIIKKALKLSQADYTEIMITGGKHSLTRFANNGIIQNLIQKDYSITIRSTIDKKSGLASCNLFKGEDLEKTVKKSYETAKLSAPDPDFITPAGPQEYIFPEESYIEDTIDYTPRMRADLADRAIQRARAKNCSASGTITTGDSMTCIANCQGLMAYHSKTESAFTLTVTNSDDGTGWAEGINQDVSELPIDNLAQKAVYMANFNKNRKKIKPGKYKVLLDPDAVANMIMFLSYLGLS